MRRSKKSSSVSAFSLTLLLACTSHAQTACGGSDDVEARWVPLQHQRVDGVWAPKQTIACVIARIDACERLRRAEEIARAQQAQLDAALIATLREAQAEDQKTIDGMEQALLDASRAHDGESRKRPVLWGIYGFLMGAVAGGVAAWAAMR